MGNHTHDAEIGCGLFPQPPTAGTPHMQEIVGSREAYQLFLEVPKTKGLLGVTSARRQEEPVTWINPTTGLPHNMPQPAEVLLKTIVPWVGRGVWCTKGALWETQCHSLELT